MVGFVEDVLLAEIRKDLDREGLTLGDAAAEQLRAAVADTVPYLSRDSSISAEARARLRRFVQRMVLNAQKAGETEISTTTVLRSRQQSDSWAPPKRS